MREGGESDGTASRRQRSIQMTTENPTVVLLHVDPKVFLFGAVCKCAVPDVDALLPRRHMHADLQREGRDLVAARRGFGVICKLFKILQRS